MRPYIIPVMFTPKPSQGGDALPVGSAIFNGVDAQARFHQETQLVADFPVTVAGWAALLPDTGSSASESFTMGDPNSALHFMGFRQHNDQFSSYFPLGGQHLLGGLLTESLQPFVVVFTENTMTVYGNGVEIQSGAHVASNIPTLQDIVVGTNPVGNVFSPIRHCHLSIHTAAFDAGDVAAHAAGTRPDALPSPFAWYPLASNGEDLIGGRTLVMTNVTFSEDGVELN